MTHRGHILSSFDDALRELKEKTIGMGSATQRNLQNAMRGLLERNKELCNQAIADDDDEDRLEIEIDHMGMSLIIKFRPLAGDLRMVLASMKTSSHLERISDQAVSIAKRARKMLKNPELQELAQIEGLYQISAGMLADALLAYTDNNTDLALAIIAREAELKRIRKINSRMISKKLESDTTQSRDYLDLLFICRWLERVGNLATNIAEDVIFEETSTDIRHGGELPERL